MAMAMMATAAMMMHLAFSQETLGQRRLSADLVSDDVASILQVSSAGFSASDSEPCEWKLSALGSNCIRPCAPMGMKCDPEQQKLLSGGGMVKVIQSLGRTCGPSPTNSLSRSAPFIEKGTNQCFPSSPISFSADSRCSASASRKHQRLCCCVPKDTSTTIASTSRFTTFTTVWPSSTTSTTSTNVGGGQGDPHIYTIWGDHYTLLKPGTFVAWNFSKGSVAWQLVACYSGARFTTQGLLLLDRNHQTMELTAEDCAWRDARHGGRSVRESEFLSHGASALEVTQVGKETEDFLSMESMIWLKMQSENGFRKVARLLVHCKPGDHMDFKVSMFDKSDMEHVGGELGATSDGKDHLSFFSSKLAVKTKTDDNFQAPGTWVGLGGSEAAAAYLNSKMQATAASLISTTCSEAEEQEAEKICGKHLQKDGNHPEIFGDCVFDICHGAGGEEVAQSAKAFIAA